MMRVVGNMVLVVSALTACIGIPVRREGVNHILATGWTTEGHLVALAQRVRVGKTAWLASPEGPGLQEVHDYGKLVLLDETQSVTQEIDLKEAGEEAFEAFPLNHGEGFLVFTMLGKQKNCYVVSNDGAASSCPVQVGNAYAPFQSYLSPASSELVSRLISRDVVLNIRTGVVRPLEDPFRQLGLQPLLEVERQQMKPCPMDAARLSPQEDIWAIGCTRAEGLETITSVWVVGRGSPSRMIYEFPALTRDELAKRSYLQYRNQTLRDHPRWPREKDGIAWSPDQRAVYWCCPPQHKGVLAYLDGRPPIEGVPCLTQVSWSPDGTRLAAVIGWAITIWKVDDAF